MIVGIGGASRSGKTWLAGKLADGFQQARVRVISQDDYIVSGLPLIRGRTDWENPASVDHGKILDEVIKASADGQLVLVEGLFAFCDPALLKLYDLKIFLAISKGIYQKRKRTDTRWGREPVWYMEHIWRSYLRYGIPHLGSPGLIIINGNIDISTTEIMTLISS